MKRSVSGISILFIALRVVAAAQQPTSTPITVDCSKGQSLNQTLANLNRQAAYTVSVNGTCTESKSGSHRGSASAMNVATSRLCL